jgi:hypothetical protein
LGALIALVASTVMNAAHFRYSVVFASEGFPPTQVALVMAISKTCGFLVLACVHAADGIPLEWYHYGSMAGFLGSLGVLNL